MGDVIWGNMPQTSRPPNGREWAISSQNGKI